jgi:hypothetical protein
MSAFTIMAHALRQELLARGVSHIDIVECEQILARVVDRTVAVASDRMQAPPGPRPDEHGS